MLPSCSATSTCRSVTDGPTTTSSGSRSNWVSTALTDATTPGTTAAAWALTSAVTWSRSARWKGRTLTAVMTGLLGRRRRPGCEASCRASEGRHRCGTRFIISTRTGCRFRGRLCDVRVWAGRTGRTPRPGGSHDRVRDPHLRRREGLPEPEPRGVVGDDGRPCGVRQGGRRPRRHHQGRRGAGDELDCDLRPRRCRHRRSFRRHQGDLRRLLPGRRARPRPRSGDRQAVPGPGRWRRGAAGHGHVGGMTSTTDAVATALADAHRREWAFVLAATVRVAGDLDLAEECARGASVDALGAWPGWGLRERRGAWLTTPARRRAVDRLRRDVTLRRKLPLLVEPAEASATGSVLGAGDETPDAAGEAAVPDDRLRLVFTCCHPALDPAARVALTLRLVCGVATPDVARAFLVPEPTMAARITRAKKKIAEARIPYRTPTATELPQRLDSVLSTVHLLFSTGHTAPTGDQLVRDDLCDRALDLARTLVTLLPAEAEARGLLGLLLLTSARRSTRDDEAGRLVLLEAQDRGRWDQLMILEGLRQTVEGLRARAPGRFALQAAIAGAHSVAPSFAETDWARVVHLYDLLLTVEPSPVVELNRAAALSFASGPAEALEVVDGLAGDPRLRAYPYLHAVRADLLRRLGRRAEACREYEAALALTANAAEREFLHGRLAELR